MNTEIITQEQANQTQNTILNVKDGSTHTITLDDLKNSVDETFDGSKPINGIRHHTMIENAQEVLDKHNMNYELDYIYAGNNKNRHMPGISVIGQQNPDVTEHPVDRLVFRRVLTRLIIHDMEDETTNTSIGLNFHQKGIEIAFGANVHVCQNMCLMGAGNLLQSYGERRMPLTEMFDALSGWLKDFQEKREFHQRVLSEMKRMEVTQRDFSELIGWLVMFAVSRNSKTIDGNREIPLNNSQINKLTEEYVKTRQEDPEKVRTLYDIYNMGTEMHKVGRTNMSEVYTSNNAFGHFLMKQFLK